MWQIRAQYATDASMAFYAALMGGGGDDVHYGLFATGQEDLASASRATTEFCGELLERHAVRRGAHVLDLGSGKGSSARWLARELGCRVTCVDLGEALNEHNRRRCRQEGVADLVDVLDASFNDPFPAEFEHAFDAVWSQEAFCHAADHGALLQQCAAALRPGGVLVFTDIMQSEAAERADVAAFTGQNHTARGCLASPQGYRAMLAAAGLQLEAHQDLSAHLSPCFRAMAAGLRGARDELLAAGVELARLDAYDVDLAARHQKVERGLLQWGAFVARKKA